jgi:hypothetical protein
MGHEQDSGRSAIVLDLALVLEGIAAEYMASMTISARRAAATGSRRYLSAVAKEAPWLRLAGVPEVTPEGALSSGRPPRVSSWACVFMQRLSRVR